MVSDHAERGVAPIQKYCELMTKDEQQLPFLLGIVQERKKSPDSRKKTLKQLLLKIRILDIVKKIITIVAAVYRFLRLISGVSVCWCDNRNITISYHVVLSVW